MVTHGLNYVRHPHLALWAHKPQWQTWCQGVFCRLHSLWSELFLLFPSRTTFDKVCVPMFLAQFSHANSRHMKQYKIKITCIKFKFNSVYFIMHNGILECRLLFLYKVMSDYALRLYNCWNMNYATKTPKGKITEQWTNFPCPCFKYLQDPWKTNVHCWNLSLSFNETVII